MVKDVFIVASQTILAMLCLTLMVNVGWAQVMSSSNYQIESDSINSGGGFSASTYFQMESTVGEVATGRSTSTNFQMQAGFQQMQGSFIAVSVPGTVALTPAIPGVSGGIATGSAEILVTTDNLAGYELIIAAAAAPAMQSGVYSIADYEPTGASADFAFDTGAADAHFGFSPEGTDIVNRFRDSVGVCGSGSDTPDRCWDGVSTTPQLIATGSGSNHPDGTTTTIQFRVEIGGSVVQPAGEYVATTTVTAVAL
jgi:hypothetical protein